MSLCKDNPGHRPNATGQNATWKIDRRTKCHLEVHGRARREAASAAIPSALSIYVFEIPHATTPPAELPRKHCTLKPRGIWNCLSLQCTSTSGVSTLVPIPFLVCGPKFTTCLENFGEDIPTSPEVIDVHTLNFKTNFKFLRLKFLGDPRLR